MHAAAVHPCLRCDKEVCLSQYACSYECGSVTVATLPTGSTVERVVHITVPDTSPLCGIFNRTRPKLDDASYFADRQEFLTASIIASLLGCNKHKTMRATLEECMLKQPNQVDNRFIHAGRVHEPYIRSLFASHYRCGLIHNEGLVIHPTKPYLGATLDGLMLDGIPVEFKTIVSRKPGQIPLPYWIQVQIQIQCCDAPYGYYVEHDVESFFSVTKIRRDDVWFAAIEPDLAYLHTVISQLRHPRCEDRVSANGYSLYIFSRYCDLVKRDTMPYDYAQFNPRWEIKISEPFQNANVVIVNFLDINEKRLQFISPLLRLSNGLFAMDFPSRNNNVKQAIRTRTLGQDTKVRLAPKLDSASSDENAFCEFHREIDEYVKQLIRENGVTWIKKDAKFVVANLDKFFTSTITPGGEYPDSISFDIGARDGILTVPFFTESGELIESPMTSIENHARVKVLYELSGLQYHLHTNKIKVLMRALEVKVYPPEQYVLSLASSTSRPVCSF